jgi:hypothetical protein
MTELAETGWVLAQQRLLLSDLTVGTDALGGLHQRSLDVESAISALCSHLENIPDASESDTDHVRAFSLELAAAKDSQHAQQLATSLSNAITEAARQLDILEVAEAKIHQLLSSSATLLRTD